jgi:hypothetical protein
VLEHTKLTKIPLCENITKTLIAILHEKARNLLRMLNEILPERTGTKQKNGYLLGWNIWKAHVVLHKAMECMMYGYSESTSAKGAKSVHKVTLICETLYLILFHTVSYCFILFTDCFSPVENMEKEYIG